MLTLVFQNDAFVGQIVSEDVTLVSIYRASKSSPNFFMAHSDASPAPPHAKSHASTNQDPDHVSRF
jgi:hypothetical protein